MREFYVRRAIGEECLRISVNATRVRYGIQEYSAQRKRLRLLQLSYLPKPLVTVLFKIINETSSFKLKEIEVKRAPIIDSPIYLKMKDVFENRKNLKTSQTYENIATIIERNGVYTHKMYTIRAKDEIESCIRDCFLNIILSMDQFGYLEDRVSEFATGGLGSAFIDRDGSILKSVGASHRLAAAQVVGMESPFPFRVIGAHAYWLQSQGIRVRDMRTFARQIRLAELDNR
jgi:hypothetical protein